MDKTVKLDSVIFAAPHEGVATGRNGTMRVSGLRAWRSLDDRYVTLEPWTSRGLIGNCRIVVPTAELPRVIAILKGMLEPETPAPTVILVTVEGGVVQSVTGIPSGVTVEVHDYDVGGDAPANLVIDPDGNGFRRGTWGGQADPAQVTVPAKPQSEVVVERGPVLILRKCRVCGDLVSPQGAASEPSIEQLRGHLEGHHAGTGAFSTAGVLEQFDLVGLEDELPDISTPEDFRCPDCGASAGQPGIVCRVCRRGITAPQQKED